VAYDEPTKLMKTEGSRCGQRGMEYWSHLHSRITLKLKFISCSRITKKLAAKTMVPGQGMSRT
jgi:hypothetical protein